MKIFKDIYWMSTINCDSFLESVDLKLSLNAPLKKYLCINVR